MSESSILTSFADIEAEEIRWLWYPYIPMGKLTLVEGSKTTNIPRFLYRLTAQVSIGNIGSEEGLRNEVLLIDGEMDPGWSKYELEKNNGDLTRIHYFPASNISKLYAAKGDIIDNGLGIIVISTIESVLVKKKKYKPADMNDNLKELSYFASETGCAVILGSSSLHEEGDDISRYLAEPIRRIPRSILSATQDDGAFRINQVKNNLDVQGKEVLWSWPSKR